MNFSVELLAFLFGGFRPAVNRLGRSLWYHPLATEFCAYLTLTSAQRTVARRVERPHSIAASLTVIHSHSSRCRLVMLY